MLLWSVIVWLEQVQWGTELAHTVLLSVENNDEKCPCLVLVHEQHIFFSLETGCTHHLCCLFLFMAVAATATASKSSSFSSSSSSSSNFEDTDAIFFWVYARNVGQRYQYTQNCMPTLQSSTHTSVDTWRHSLHIPIAHTYMHMHTRTDTWRHSFKSSSCPTWEGSRHVKRPWHRELSQLLLIRGQWWGTSYICSREA